MMSKFLEKLTGASEFNPSSSLACKPVRQWCDWHHPVCHPFGMLYTTCEGSGTKSQCGC